MRIVIVGGGIVAAYMAKALSKHEHVEVVILSEEHYAPYDRIHLCSLVDDSKTIDTISLELPKNVQIELNAEVVDLDTKSKRVFTEHAAYKYDKLIIATGSKPRELFDASGLENVTGFRSADDAKAIANGIKDKNVVLVGVGPIGLELLETLSEMNNAKNIYLISRGEHLYSKELDPQLVHFMQKSYESNPKVHVLYNESIQNRSIEANRVTQIELNSQVIDDPYIVFGVGIQPHIDFVQAHLECDKGVLVDHYLCSSNPDIYAVGEAAQLPDGYIAGRVKECTLQADAALSHLLDETPKPFKPIVAIDGLKVGSFMLSDVSSPDYKEEDPHNEELLLTSKESKRFDQYIINNEKLVRFIGINSNVDVLTLQSMIEASKPVDVQLFYQNRIESAKGKLICSCVGAFEADIVKEVKAHACSSFNDLKPYSKAGRVCGRCKEDVTKIIAATEIDPEEAQQIQAQHEAQEEAEREATIRAKIEKFNTLHPDETIETASLDAALKSFELHQDFNAWVSQLTASLRLHPEYESSVKKGVQALTKIPIIWLELSDCTGNSEAFIKTANPSVDDLILKYVSLDYHELLMAPSGDQSETQLDHILKAHKGEYLLLVEGAIPMAMEGKYLRIGPKGETGIDLLKRTASNALAVMAIGSCAFDGGVVAAAPNPTGAVGVSEALGRDDIINLPGCPVNPINIVGTLLHYLMFNELPKLDAKNRPEWAYSTRVHDNCERRGHYDMDEFVLEWGDEGAKKGWCLYKMGCKGPYADVNCANVKFNEATSWPVQSGHGCFGCSEGVIAFDRYANNRPLKDSNG